MQFVLFRRNSSVPVCVSIIINNNNINDNELRFVSERNLLAAKFDEDREIR